MYKVPCRQISSIKQTRVWSTKKCRQSTYLGVNNPIRIRHRMQHDHVTLDIESALATFWDDMRVFVRTHKHEAPPSNSIPQNDTLLIRVYFPTPRTRGCNCKPLLACDIVHCAAQCHPFSILLEVILEFSVSCDICSADCQGYIRGAVCIPA